MSAECFPHQIDQSLHVHRGTICSAAVAMVDGAVGVSDENGECKVVVELELTDIKLIDVRDSSTDVLFGYLSKRFGGTDNLPIEKATIDSGLAPKDNQHRLALSPCFRSSCFEICSPRKTEGRSGLEVTGKRNCSHKSD